MASSFSFPSFPQTTTQQVFVRTMASGRCTAVFTAGKYKTLCLCLRGIFDISTINTGDPECQECEHPLSQHKDASSTNPLSATDQPSPELLKDDPYICPRTDTVEKLATILDERRVVHVRGTPSSGKTTLALLLWKYYRDRKERVIFLNGWQYVSDTRIHLADICKAHGYGVEPYTLTNANIIFIFDEAQQTYDNECLWNGPIKTTSGSDCGLRICLFSSYGSPTTGITQCSPGSPIHLGFSQRISIAPSHFVENGRICLFYNEEEFEDVVRRRCSICRFKLDSAARTYLYSITNGHPGATDSLLTFIFMTYRSDLRNHVIEYVTKDLFIRALDDESKVFNMLKEYPVQGSFPSREKLTVEAADVLRRVRENGNIPCQLDDPGIRLCYEEGWVHSDITDTDTEKIVCVLPSKLHEKFVEYHLGLCDPLPFPFEKFPTLLTFCEAVLRNFSRSNLLLSRKGPLGASARVRSPEAQFQDEWYRSFNSLLGHGFAISSEWSQYGNGRIDFRIIGPKWGIELLRDGDGDRLTEHCNRFLDNGAYHHWIADGSMKDWIILDCRHSCPQRYRATGTKLWRVVFESDYSSAYVLDCDNREIIPKFLLMN